MESAPNFFENLTRFKEEFLKRLEDIVTSPGNNEGISVRHFEILQKTGKILWSIEADKLADAIAADLHIDTSQLVVIKREIFY